MRQAQRVLELYDITKTYGGKSVYTALKGISLTLAKGDFVALMGPSGSGKTTLLNIAAGLDRPSEGSVLIDRRNPAEMSLDALAVFRRKTLGFVYQDFNLMDTLTVGENILLPAAFELAEPNASRERARELASELGIEDVFERRISEISGGQAQRTAVARALMNNPAFVLADEPTGSLDSAASGELMRLFKRLNAERGATLLLATHSAAVASFCKRVLFIKDGRLYQEIVRGDDGKIFHQRILDAVNLLGGMEDDVI